MLLAADVVAFNDHISGPDTAVTTTAYAANSLSQGSLVDSVTGQLLAAALETSASGVSYENASSAPALGTDADLVFSGAIDFGSGAGESIALSGADSYTHSFTGLTDTSIYSFTGTAIRGRTDYTNRWTLVTLVGADSFTAAHSDGAGIVTGGLAANQVALWTGANHGSDQGFVASWTDIDPGADGEFSIVSEQYTGSTPGVGTGSADGSKGYALSAIQLVQSFPFFSVESTDPGQNATLLTIPTEYTVDFNKEINPATLDAADLTINGQAATGVVLVDPDTVRFTLPELDGVGSYAVAIADGAIASTDSEDLAPFADSFIILDDNAGGRHQ